MIHAKPFRRQRLSLLIRWCPYTAFAVISLVFSVTTMASQPQPGKMRVIIDADTANEVDDLFAIARALVAPECQIEGLTSALWRHRGTPNSVELSQALNEKLLDLAGLRDTIAHPQGSAEPLRDTRTPQDSPAVRQHLAGCGALWDFLLEYWEKHRRYGKIERTRMWDVALVQAFLRPHLAQRTITGAPIVHAVDRVEEFPDNPRRVTVFSKIDVSGMLADYWEAAGGT